MNRWLRTGAFFVSLAGSTLAPSLARADAIAPDEASCTGKSAGDACSVNNVDGHCATKKCTKLDYSDGSPPGTKEVDCLVCVATGLDGSTPSDGGGGSDAATPGADAAANGTNGTNGGGGNGSSSSGGCALAGVPGARAFGPWLLALLPLLVLRKRSRNQA